MKKLITLMTMMILFAVPAQAKQPKCATIKDGGITDTAGNPVITGYDEYGYNYQAHMFNGTYDSSDRTIDGAYWGDVVDYANDKLMMKWSDSWLANVDCNNDNKLDRGLVDGEVSGTSMGWLTNHWTGEYELDGKTHHFTDFVKIVWMGPEGSLWGQYEIIQEVWNDKPAGYSGLLDKLGSPGFGLNDHWTTL